MATPGDSSVSPDRWSRGAPFVARTATIHRPLGPVAYDCVKVEVRALDSETARLLHQRLCGWIDPGKTGKASIDTLCGYVWPSEASGSTMRKRRQRVREALPIKSCY
ncbi:replication protein C, IncQ-type [Acinetobacter pseudolwoffii]|uniref:replication protein C, IncQ-type n=1 Tax=Acinetobacter pseudolwoffii TaxID=2053287 RepID=UPI003D9C08ED